MSATGTVTVETLAAPPPDFRYRRWGDEPDRSYRWVCPHGHVGKPTARYGMAEHFAERHARSCKG